MLTTVKRTRKTDDKVRCNKCDGLLVLDMELETIQIKCVNCGKRIFMPEVESKDLVAVCSR